MKVDGVEHDPIVLREMLHQRVREFSDAIGAWDDRKEDHGDGYDLLIGIVFDAKVDFDTLLEDIATFSAKEGPK